MDKFLIKSNWLHWNKFYTFTFRFRLIGKLFKVLLRLKRFEGKKCTKIVVFLFSTPVNTAMADNNKIILFVGTPLLNRPFTETSNTQLRSVEGNSCENLYIFSIAYLS